MHTSVQLVLLLFSLFALASTVSGLSCYQCNVECRNHTAGCDSNDPSVFINDTETDSKRVSCESNAEADNCVACMKIRTGYRRFDGRGEFMEGELISKICQKTASPYTEDTCEENGPAWSKKIICYCYSDYCNSAPRFYTLTIPVLALILHAVL